MKEIDPTAHVGAISSPFSGGADTTLFKRYTTPSGVKYYVGHTQGSTGSSFGQPSSTSPNVEIDYNAPPSAPGRVDPDTGQMDARNKGIEAQILQHFATTPDAVGKTGYFFSPTDMSTPMNNPTGKLKAGQGQSIQDYYDQNIPSGDPTAMKNQVAQKMV